MERADHVAEVLQAPVATSVSGKGVISECHPLAVGWGYGPQGTRAAENAFKKVDVVLAIGVRYSEVSTGFYSIPQSPHLIHVDINPTTLAASSRRKSASTPTPACFWTICSNTPTQSAARRLPALVGCIRKWKSEDAKRTRQVLRPLRRRSDGRSSWPCAKPPARMR